ncbi:hypothetical protein [Psychroflexus aestuariivivens]|uniref:hypothetical protein n=1 Tax=Psychroflexus aestuariivivens TaxID=1795040 RepID=UPI000FDCB720|nr:hypothetical protein [Psychroflexus aestuariivivens]
MKRLFLILLSFCFVSCVFRPVHDKNIFYDYNQDVEFRLLGMNKKRTIDKDHGRYTEIAKKGRRFISIVFEFKNNSSKIQIIDFEKFFIRDQNSALHKVDGVVMAKKFTSTNKRFQQKLKPNKTRTIFVQFIPSFDKNEKIKTLIIDDEVFELKLNE